MSNISTTQDMLWDNWIKEQDNDTGNKLIESYFYLVNYHVQRIAAHLPNSVSKDDIKSLGLFGLYDALKKFEPSRDLKFDTYASFRIRGAIMDGLRKEDWLSRSARDKTKQVERTSQLLEQKLQRQPTSNEIAKELNITASEIEEIVKDSLFANLLSIEEKSSDSNDDYKEGVGYNLPDENNPLPEQHLIRGEDYQELEIGIQQLNSNEQMVVSLFYKEELTFTEIGHVLELTTSRISQIHKQAIFKLRKTLSQNV
ncbi:FliA/WhiG family RNA polymerase sigma factor [Aquibacillus rhizosphaerae]|uniref:FliA/WhiG family RNA polymerase sigma factor n=1 Tax=Aquibacillus rhizosphaerae TaxID=3051431 RepID=A0ABT7L2K1_9BACI|nr:FliA/WhiG family RNA polymerase sigma factor [Aquibacillus sp. LR5S19]MDL4840087.1 FliA/WhiG family RNA polymerase sigma factor [Aquibacillus sp. LR5S19]